MPIIVYKGFWFPSVVFYVIKVSCKQCGLDGRSFTLHSQCKFCYRHIGTHSSHMVMITLPVFQIVHQLQGTANAQSKGKERNGDMENRGAEKELTANQWRYIAEWMYFSQDHRASITSLPGIKNFTLSVTVTVSTFHLPIAESHWHHTLTVAYMQALKS